MASFYLFSMESVKWFDRTFDFGFTENIFPLIVSRLKKTPDKLFQKIKEIPVDYLSIRKDKVWSVKENIGHLTDLEPLWQQRLDDILTGREEMHPADLSNKKTDLANHNSRSSEYLLEEFSEARNQTICMLENLDEDAIFKSSRHPRLRTPMRTMDLFLFVAEHDDHHFERIVSLENQLRHLH
jgi:uncharacterized damage-inducible protein DinB